MNESYQSFFSAVELSLQNTLSDITKKSESWSYSLQDSKLIIAKKEINLRSSNREEQIIFLKNS
jgi:hypothetical protein